VASTPEPVAPDDLLIAFLAARAVELESGADDLIGDGTNRRHRLTAEKWRVEAAYLRAAIKTARRRRASEHERAVVDTVLRRLAQPWVNHRDFQEAWRPQ
jgi:hypothetical protein